MGQEIFLVLMEHKVPLLIFKNPPVVPILSQMISVHAIPSASFKIHFIIILPSFLGLVNRLFSSGYRTKTLCEFLFSPIRVVTPTHHILPDLIKLIIFSSRSTNH